MDTQELLIANLEDILDGLTVALSGKLSRKLLPYDKMQSSLTAIKRKAENQGLELTIDSIRHIFECKLSYLLFPSHIELYVHLPLTTDANEFTLRQLHPTPILVPRVQETETSDIVTLTSGNDITKAPFWTIQDGGKLLAISKDGANLFEINFHALQLCTKVGTNYYC